jgi:hypothetical protein
MLRICGESCTHRSVSLDPCSIALSSIPSFLPPSRDLPIQYAFHLSYLALSLSPFRAGKVVLACINCHTQYYVLPELFRQRTAPSDDVAVLSLGCLGGHNLAASATWYCLKASSGSGAGRGWACGAPVRKLDVWLFVQAKARGGLWPRPGTSRFQVLGSPLSLRGESGPAINLLVGIEIPAGALMCLIECETLKAISYASRTSP